MRRRDVLALVAAAGLPWSGKARAAHAEFGETVGFAGHALFLATKVPALVIDVVRNGQVSIQGFGHRGEGPNAEPDGDTVLRIGSITKAFTGQMLASLAADGVITLAGRDRNSFGSYGAEHAKRAVGDSCPRGARGGDGRDGDESDGASDPRQVADRAHPRRGFARTRPRPPSRLPPTDASPRRSAAIAWSASRSSMTRQSASGRWR